MAAPSRPEANDDSVAKMSTQNPEVQCCACLQPSALQEKHCASNDLAKDFAL